MKPIADPDTEFASSEALAYAVDAPLPTIKTWIARKDIVLIDAEAPGRGTARRWSLRRVNHIALVVRLARAGASPSAASMAAAKWTDVGKGDPRDGRTILRYPGDVFRKGQTYFIAHIARDGSVPHADVTNSDSLFEAVAHAHADTIVAVHLNQLAMDVRTRLEATR